jgi:ribonucleotide reductase alpha subunit
VRLRQKTEIGSVYNSVEAVRLTNKRRKTGGYYAGKAELEELCLQTYPAALKNASYEAYEGQYDVSELAEMVDENDIRNESLKLILQRMPI